MNLIFQKLPWFVMLLACLVHVIGGVSLKKEQVEPVKESGDNSTKELLKASETADPKKVDIVKEIRRLNDDGSYTVGYEAGDGTFKIESRDVLGNVKGTYGYIDDRGEVKRVTYSSMNSTSTTVTSSAPPSVAPSKPSRTVSSRRQPTIVYPRGSHSTRATVIQPIPRKKNNDDGDSKEENKTERSLRKVSALNTKVDDTIMKPIKLYTLPPHTTTTEKEYVQTKFSAPDGTMKPYQSSKLVYEPTTEKPENKQHNKANTNRRQLSSTGNGNDNPQMLSLQQSLGGDSTDVYGGALGPLGTIRPLYTTTTPRPRLIPFQTIIAARDKLREHLSQIPISENSQETTIEASSGGNFEAENVVTSNPVPVVHIPVHRDKGDEKLYQPFYQHLSPIQFRTRDYLRDNPGAPIPIGNQRPYFAYEFLQQNRKEETVPRGSILPRPAQTQEVNVDTPYSIRQGTRLIPIPVDERGIPIQGYQQNYIPSYNTQLPPPIPERQQFVQVQPIHDPPPVISTPVSTRDLKRLLNYLLLRQQKLQTMMDDISTPGPPYQPLPLYRASNSHYQEQEYRPKQMIPPAVNYQSYVPPRQFHLVQPTYVNQPNYDRQHINQPNYDRQHVNQANYDRRQEVYNNRLSNYETNSVAYDSPRYVRRRIYRPNYDDEYEDADGANSNHIQEHPDFLPSDVREALLLKMLMLALNHDYVPLQQPRPPPVEALTEMTTAMPEKRKKIRNIQILGEVGSNDGMKPRS